MKGMICELCSKEASVYCDSDHAFLCWTCDADVHQANFLVARHVREPLCSNCKGFTGGFISGEGLRRNPRFPICRSCSPDESSGEDQADSLSSSSSVSSACVSSNGLKTLQFVDQPKIARIGPSISVTELSSEESSLPAIFSGEVMSKKTSQSLKKKKNNKMIKKVNEQIRPRGPMSVDAKAEGIFGNWCRELGLNGNSAVVSLASHALSLCVGRSSVLPFRVSLAASFWWGLRSCVDKSARALHCLKRLEDVSRVPARLILTVGFKLDRELSARKSRRHDLAEGWAECSGKTAS
ncbi:Zinc finger protein CONSTANS-LIKE 2 [Morus notabilis]|uniref:Zinc finger protein CONSTANS-LIKE 2 n=1 Tax=Morus notabilis TaxID=981085 RepID=W9QXL1_9ROSA|nr:B-box zinc finger protein 32 [Morus notabilis]EXB26151.1 Zinc finger protein CONSTANS-LIKE 2 [Morus notabilis]